MSSRSFNARIRLVASSIAAALGSVAWAGPSDYTIQYAFGTVDGQAILHTGVDTVLPLQAMFESFYPVESGGHFAHDTNGLGSYPTDERLVDATGWALLHEDPLPSQGNFDFAILAQSEVVCNDEGAEAWVRSYVMVDFYVQESFDLKMEVEAITMTENLESTLVWGRSLVNLDLNHVIIDEEHIESAQETGNGNSIDTTIYEESVGFGGWHRAEVWTLTESSPASVSVDKSAAFALSRMNIRFFHQPPLFDANLDERVDGLDLAMVLSAWGSSNERLDFNLDGIVNGLDLAMLLAAWDA